MKANRVPRRAWVALPAVLAASLFAVWRSRAPAGGGAVAVATPELAAEEAPPRAVLHRPAEDARLGEDPEVPWLVPPPTRPRRDVRLGLRDEAGKRLEGIGVRLRYLGFEEDEDLEAFFARRGSARGIDLVRLWLEPSKGAGPSGRSDRLGRVQLAGVPEAEYVVELEHEFLHAVKAEVEVDEDSEREDVEIRVREGGLVEGLVLDERGDPVPDAVVVLVEPAFWGLPLNTTRTDARGAYALRGVPAAAEVFVAAACEGRAPARSEPLRVERGQRRSAPFLFLRPGGSLAVAVRDAATGAPLTEFQLELEPEDGSFLDFAGRFGHHPGGDAELLDLAPLRYSLKVSAPGYQRLEVDEIVIRREVRLQRSVRLSSAE
jgi:hypothetical protein